MENVDEGKARKKLKNDVEKSKESNDKAYNCIWQLLATIENIHVLRSRNNDNNVNTALITVISICFCSIANMDIQSIIHSKSKYQYYMYMILRKGLLEFDLELCFS